MIETCPLCGDRMVFPCGDEKYDILLAGEYPGWEESQRGIPFVGETGKILDAEMMRVGINIWRTRLTNLWLHDKNKNPSCFEMGVKSLTREMEGRKVLLMGSELATYFLNDKVMDWAGMEVTSPLFPKSVQFVMIAPNPAVCLHQPLGEFRHAVELFAERSKR